MKTPAAPMISVKSKIFPPSSLEKTAFIFCVLIIASVSLADNFKFVVTPADIIASSHSKGFNYKNEFENVALRFAKERGQLIAELIAVLSDSKSSNLDQCAAAYYLGEMRATEAVDYLAYKINLNLDLDQLNLHSLPVIGENCARDALVKIGSRSIPSLLRNIESSGDSKIRESSLITLVMIEQDKDVVKLRLAKALKLEADSKMVENLNAALKELEK